MTLTLDKVTVELEDMEIGQSEWAKSLLHSLNDMRQSNSLCDVIVSSQDNFNFNVHSAVMGAGSEFFRRILTQPKNAGSGIIIKLEKSRSLTEKVLDFLYTGKTAAQLDELEELMSMADGYGVQRLHQLCSERWTQITSGAEAVVVKTDEQHLDTNMGDDEDTEDADSQQVTEDTKATIELVTQTQDELEPTGESSTCENLYACKVCDLIFYDINDLSEHQLTHAADQQEHELQMMEIVTLGENEDDLAVIEALNSVSQAEQQTPTVYLDVYPSVRTPRTTSSVKKTWRDYRYTCKSCNKEFSSASRLRGHESTHDGERRHQCTICGQKFIQIEYLREHITMHSDERPFECPVCNQKFRLQRHLKKHQVVHNPTKPFQCTQCSASFRKQDALNQHNMKHSGEKPHSCDICLKKFRCIEGLNHHKNVLHGKDAPYRCGFCNIGFKKTQDLERHKDVCKKACAKRRLMCTDCGLYFKNKATLLRHMRFKHNRSNLPQTAMIDTNAEDEEDTENEHEHEENEVPSDVVEASPTSPKPKRAKPEKKGGKKVEPPHNKRGRTGIFIVNDQGEMELKGTQIVQVGAGAAADNPNMGLETLFRVIQGQEAEEKEKVIRIQQDIKEKSAETDSGEAAKEGVVEQEVSEEMVTEEHTQEAD